MKIKLILLISILLLSCDKKNALELPKVVEGSSDQYTVFIKQNILTDSGDYVEMHDLIGKYGYSIKVEKGYYNIQVEPDYFYFDNKPIDFPMLNQDDRTNFKIPISKGVKETLTAVIGSDSSSAFFAKPNAAYEKSLLGMIPQIAVANKNKRISVLEETEEKITISTTYIYKIPALKDLEHNIECNDTSLEVISKITGLLIRSETTSVTQGLIFAKNAPKPLRLTIKAKITIERKKI